jgi:hypothetical protein
MEQAVQLGRGRREGGGPRPHLHAHLRRHAAGLLLACLAAGAALSRLGEALVVPQPLPQPSILLPQIRQLRAGGEAGRHGSRRWCSGQRATTQPAYAAGEAAATG